MAFRDLTGHTIGQLRVLRLVERAGRRGRTSRWECECSCGATVVKTASALTGDRPTKSCGCLKRRMAYDNPNTNARPILDRLAEKSYTDLVSRCVVWTGKTLHFGHGHFSVAGKMKLTHRAAWEEERGPIPDGMDCLHHCDNPPCWNVDHLFLGTQADNNSDRDAKGRHVPCPGEEHGMSKLKEAQVLAIRADPRPPLEIAKSYGISRGNVDFIQKRKTWKHLP